MTSVVEHLKYMFEKSLFSDVCLLFSHSTMPLDLSFQVHKSILSQSPFFEKQFERMQCPGELSIDLKTEWARCGFTNFKGGTGATKEFMKSLVKNMLKWFYCADKQNLIETMINNNNNNLLDVLSLAILFDIPELINECVDQYVHQLDLDCVIRDIGLICQFPRQHPAYLKLRNRILLILVHKGPNDFSKLVQLPVDYLSRVLSSNLLFVPNEFSRYQLLKAVFRLAHKEDRLFPQHRYTYVLPFLDKYPLTTASEVRLNNRKRLLSNNVWNTSNDKRRKIESETVSEVEKENNVGDDDDTMKINGKEIRHHPLGYEDVSDISETPREEDKPGTLIKLLQNFIYYSNMTFQQFNTIRGDEIVDENIIFRALWQKKTLERMIDPMSHNRILSQQPSSTDLHALTAFREENRELSTPRFRFSSIIPISSPKEDDKWKCEHVSFYEEENLLNAEEEEEGGGESVVDIGDSEKKTHKVYKQTFHSSIEELPYGSYQVELEAVFIVPYDSKPPSYPQHLNNQQQDTRHNIKQQQLYCKFKLNSINHVKEEAKSQVNYSIYCFNDHNNKGDDSDIENILKAVTIQKLESTRFQQVIISTDLQDKMEIHVAVVAEILDFGTEQS